MLRGSRIDDAIVVQDKLSKLLAVVPCKNRSLNGIQQSDSRADRASAGHVNLIMHAAARRNLAQVTSRPVRFGRYQQLVLGTSSTTSDHRTHADALID